MPEPTPPRRALQNPRLVDPPPTKPHVHAPALALGSPRSESLLTSRMDRPLPNSYWVIPGRLLAGEYPGGTDFTDSRARLARVRAAGIDYFVDLTEEGELPAYRHLLPFHIKYLRCAIADRSVPSDGVQVQTLLTDIR